MSFPTISPAELLERARSGRPVQLLDVRTPAEFREAHVRFARNMPLERLEPEALERATPEEPLYLICRSGNRSSQACRQLLAAGHGAVVNVDGGIMAWERAGLPVERGRKAISLERQVRIAAGLLAMLGGLGALLHHPYWAGLSAFVGAGLTFAGVTDTCGMAMLLARMPWNQVGEEPQGQGCGC